MKMKKLSAVMMGGVMAMSLAACGSSGGSAPAATTAAPAATTAAAASAAPAAEAPADGEVYVVRVGDTV